MKKIIAAFIAILLAVSMLSVPFAITDQQQLLQFNQTVRETMGTYADSLTSGSTVFSDPSKEKYIAAQEIRNNFLQSSGLVLPQDQLNEENELREQFGFPLIDEHGVEQISDHTQLQTPELPMKSGDETLDRLNDEVYRCLIPYTSSLTSGDAEIFTPFKEAYEKIFAERNAYLDKTGLTLPEGVLKQENDEMWRAGLTRIDKYGKPSYTMPGDDEPTQTTTPGQEPVVLEEQPSSWAAAFVTSALEAGIVPDTMKKDFQKPTTRTEFCEMALRVLWAANGKPGSSFKAYVHDMALKTSNPFFDTNSESDYVAKSLGIISGTSSTTFNPTGTVTRQEAAVMLAQVAKLCELPSYADKMLKFSDLNKCASWAQPAVQNITTYVGNDGTRIIAGVEPNVFGPTGLLTHEQALIIGNNMSHIAVSSAG